MTIRAAWHDVRKTVVVRAPGADVEPEAMTYRITVPAHGDWSATLSVIPVEGNGPVVPFVHPDEGEMSPRDLRRQEWVAKIPVLHIGNQAVERTVQRSYDDLGALRIEETEPSTMLANAIAETHPEAWGCAAKIQFRLEMGLSAVLTRDEVASLGLHVARLVADLRG